MSSLQKVDACYDEQSSTHAHVVEDFGLQNKLYFVQYGWRGFSCSGQPWYHDGLHGLLMESSGREKRICISFVQWHS